MSVVVLSMALAATHEIDPAGAQSALTVGNGQYQIESTIIGLNRTGVTGLMGRRKNLTLGITTLRIGVDDDLEYQVAFNGAVIDDESPGESKKINGINDTIVAAKWNLWGQSGSPTAFAIRGALGLPTSDLPDAGDDVDIMLNATWHRRYRSGQQLEVRLDLGNQDNNGRFEETGGLAVNWFEPTSFGGWTFDLNNQGLFFGTDYQPTVSVGAEIELDTSTVIDLGMQQLFDQDNDDDTLGAWIGLTRRF